MEEAGNTQKNLSEVLKELVKSNENTMLKTTLADLHPADIADAMERLSVEEGLGFFTLLDLEKAAEIMVELDSSRRQEILQVLDEDRMVQIIGIMDSDDATDVIGELNEETAKRVLNAMPRKEVRDVRTLLIHDEETAGGIMALEIVAVNQDRTVEDAMEAIRHKSDEVDDVYNIYVVDTQGVLQGIVSLKELVLAKRNYKLSEIMNRDIVKIHQAMDQEEVAKIFHKYDLVAAPVVDEKERLVGRITVDDVLDVVEEEANEDMTLMAGITDETLRERSIFKVTSVRLPWLLVAFAGETVSAFIMSHFQASLDQILVAAFFIPLIMAMGGNTGIQSATVVIRGLATGEFSLRDTGHQLIREISVSLLNGLIISLLLFGVTVIWLQQPRFGIVLCVAMIAVLFNAAFMGTLMPFLLKRIGVDPAVATGPFITTSNDVLGLLVYFGLMTFFLQWL